MKSREIPPALMFGGIGLLVLIIAAVAYSMFLKPTPEVDLHKLTPEQQSDPERRPGSPGAQSGR